MCVKEPFVKMKKEDWMCEHVGEMKVYQVWRKTIYQSFPIGQIFADKERAKKELKDGINKKDWPRDNSQYIKEMWVIL